MNKTYNINLGGLLFTVDDDAYNMLKDYLDTLTAAFSSNSDAEELIADIEARIAELLTARLTESGRTIVAMNDVAEIINQIGRPSDFVEEETIEIKDRAAQANGADSIEVDMETGGAATPPPMPESAPRFRRKLFRNPQDAMLGGVCSGLAAFIGIDPNWVRLGTLILTLLSFSTVAIVYIVLWIVLPEAKTPLQRMQMRGEQPTIGNIGRTVMQENGADGEQPTNSPVGTLTHICNILAKIIMIGAFIVAVPLLIVLAVAFIICLMALIFVVSGAGIAWLVNIDPAFEILGGVGVINALICGLMCILAIGIPCFWVSWAIMNSVSKKGGSISKGWRVALLVCWLFSIAGAGISTACVMDDVKRVEEMESHIDNISNEADSIADSIDSAAERIDSIASVIDAEHDKITEASDELAAAHPADKAARKAAKQKIKEAKRVIKEAKKEAAKEAINASVEATHAAIDAASTSN